ncbi:MAG TPA: site-specific integrase [Chloroflexota bacterium]|jgi:integrase
MSMKEQNGAKDRKSRRRANGEGTVYYNERLGLYVGQVVDRNGKRRTVYGKTQADALAKKAKLLRDVADNRPTTPARLTLGQLLAEYLEAEKIHTKKVSGYARLESCVRCHLLPALQTKRVAAFSTKDVNAFVRTKQEERCAHTSILLMIHCLRRAFALAENYSYIPKGANPVAGATLPPLPDRQPCALTQEQAKRLLNAARGDRYEALYVLALTSGLRISELCGLRWDDLDLDRAQVTVRKKLLYVNRVLVDDEAPKRDELPPTLPLHRLAVAALRAHKKRQAEERLAYPGEWARPDLVFTIENGKPLRGNVVAAHHLPKLLKKVGLGHFTPHSLRASACTIAAERGADISVAQHLLRHKDPATTMRYYRAVRPHEVTSAVARIGDALAEDETDMEESADTQLQ